MKKLTLEGIYRNGTIEIEDVVDFKTPQRVLIVFVDKDKPVPKTEHFSFSESLELTKNCKGKLSDIVIEERRKEKW